MHILRRVTYVSLLCSGLLFTTMVVSCSDDNDGPKYEPKVLSTTPVDGSNGIHSGDIVVQLVFDQSVKLTPTGFSKVSIDGAKVTRVSPNDDVLLIYISEVKRARSYELIVDKGTVVNEYGVENTSTTVSFTTVENPSSATIDSELCSSDPMPETVRLYNYFRSIYGKRTLTTSMANVSWNLAEAELVNKEVGEYPAMAVMDYIHLHYAPASWIDYNYTEFIEDWRGKGGIVGAMWHWRVPKNEADSNPDNFTYAPWETDFRPRNIFVEGSWENRVAIADLEEMASYLLLLQEKDISVVWRPLHEGAGNACKGGEAWFWWGIDGGETYIKLWRFMFDFFKEKGVRNLIWVWTTEMNDRIFYPGDEYVDIIGRDIYNVTEARVIADEYNAILTEYPNKMIALSECGTVAPMSEQWEAGACWLYVMPWYIANATTLEGHGCADTNWWKNAFEQDFIYGLNDIVKSID